MISFAGMIAWTILFVLLLTGYCLIMWLVIRGWQKTPEWIIPPDFHPGTKVSILLPVRIEAENISASLEALFVQNYPKELFEILVIDDHSTDSTFQILSEIKDPRLKVFRLQENTGFGKKAALLEGLKNAGGDIIITTDADCMYHPLWLQSFVSFYENHKASVVAGPISIVGNNDLLSIFQKEDNQGMMGVTAAGLLYKKLPFANGANLSFRKDMASTYRQCLADNATSSGDDVFFMEQVLKRNPEAVYFLKSKTAIVETKALPNLNQFFQQRLRWASKTSLYQNQNLKWVQAVVFLFTISILFALLAGFFYPVFWEYFLVGFAVKFGFDLVLLRSTGAFFMHRSSVLQIFLLEFMYLIYFPAVGLLSFRKDKISWKGRKIVPS
jgi:glycosyltransferase involved in cell wall biosynthesis